MSCRSGLNTDGRELVINFVEGRGFQINSEIFPNLEPIFFTDLTRVKAWYGGVREDRLKRLVKPKCLVKLLVCSNLVLIG